MRHGDLAKISEPLTPGFNKRVE